MKKPFKKFLSAAVSLIMLLQCVIIGEFSIPAEAALEAPSDNYAYLNPADYDGDLSQDTPAGLNSRNWLSYLPDNACLSEINIRVHTMLRRSTML